MALHDSILTPALELRLNQIDAWVDGQTKELELRERLKIIIRKQGYLTDPDRTSLQVVACRYGWDGERILNRLVDNRGYCECNGCDLAAPIVKRWCIDHSHETGRPRGIVCQSCNLAIRGEARLEMVVKYIWRRGELQSLLRYARSLEKQQ